MFQVPLITICECYVRHPKLFVQHNLNSLTERLDTALEYIEPKYILRDITVLQHSSTKISSHLEQAKSVGIKSLRPSMIKCSQEKLNRIIELHLNEKMARGQHENVASFLAEKLNLDVESTQAMLDRYPHLYNYSMANVRYYFLFKNSSRDLVAKTDYVYIFDIAAFGKDKFLAGGRRAYNG